MKKRGTISRCCCGASGGGGGGAGVCVDACLSSWNSCAPDATGGIVFTDADGWDGCDWVSSPFGNQITGSNGNFYVVSQWPLNSRNTAVKHFSFDYRTTNTLEIQADVEVSNLLSYTFLNQPVARAGIGILTEELTLNSISFAGAGNLVNPPFLSTSSGLFENTDLTTATLKIVATIGEVQSTRVGTYAYFNGTQLVNATGCIDSVSITYESYVNGAVVFTSVNPLEFAGGRCYGYANARLDAFQSRTNPNSATAETSEMTITVS